MNGATIYYRPAGFREIKQILIAFNEEDSETIATLQNQGDTQGAEEAKKAALANIQEKAQGVLVQLKKDGSNFDEVMKENTDDTTTEPYAVGNLGEDTSYVEAFTQPLLPCKTRGIFPVWLPRITGIISSAMRAIYRKAPCPLKRSRLILKSSCFPAKNRKHISSSWKPGRPRWMLRSMRIVST